MRSSFSSCGSLLILVTLGAVAKQRNNVCKTFPDYYLDMEHNKNCYYNPDGELSVPEVIKRHGYPVERYNVTTKDGYILTLFRIPYGKNSVDQKPGPPVLLQHGISLNCACFVVRGRKSLGFILADAGYDVWLGNLRGSVYSRVHTDLSETEAKYWDFSYHEMGTYDLPAQIDFISEINTQKITYIGFSMGTTSAYIYGVTYPDIAYEKVKIFISMAPIAYLKYIKTVIKYLVPLYKYIEPALEELTNGHLSLRNFEFVKRVCLPYPFQMQFCELGSSFVFGFDYEQDDPETLPITLMQNKDDTSVKLVSHYVQFIETGKFQQFDYGIARNVMKYGSPLTPQYNLSKMKVPNYLIRGENDLLGTKENVEKLYASLPAQAKPYPIYVVDNDKFNHGDFLNARDVVPLLYDHIVNFMKS